MYRDNSLVPKEAIRLAALGMLYRGERSYTDVSSEIRQFIGRIVGPSLDLLGTSMELLKFEGLIEPVDGLGMEDNATLRLTDAGRDALMGYLSSNVRPAVNDFNRLVIALKLRFLDILPVEEQRDQIEQLRDVYLGERERLLSLTKVEEWADGMLPAWLALDIEQINGRIDWCEAQLAIL